MAQQENNHTRVTIPIQGIDTSTPDLTVPDGKCEELHNLRWAAGAWHDVPPLTIKQHLGPAAGFEEWFSSLTILYHHPATDNRVYIASTPNSDGTINLIQVSYSDDGILSRYPCKNLNPLYLRIFVTRSGTNISIMSFDLVASDVTVDLIYSDSTGNKTSRQIIPKNSNISQGLPLINEFDVKILNIDTATPTPSADDIYTYRFYETKTEAKRDQDSILAENLSADIRITHFGNILILIDKHTKQTTHYLLFNHAYEKYQIPAPPNVSEESLNKKTLPFKHGYFYFEANIPGYPIKTEYWYPIVPICNTATDTYFLSENYFDGYWHGEICYFAAFQMKDGTYIAPTELHFAVSELDNCTKDARKYVDGANTGYRSLARIEYYDGEQFGWNPDHLFHIKTAVMMNMPIPPDTYVPEPSTMNFCIKPKVKIALPKNVNRRLINSVTLFSTRINPLFDMEKMKTIAIQQENKSGNPNNPYYNYYTNDARAVYAENNLPEQPFYKVKDILLDDFTNGEYMLELTHELLKDITTNQTYQATQNMHDIFYSGVKEYNSRAHLYGLYTSFFPGYINQFSFNSPDTALTEADVYTTIDINDRKYVVRADGVQVGAKTSKILSYPDYRAVKMQLFNASKQLINTPMKPALANNIAYACRPADESETDSVAHTYVKYPCFTQNPLDDSRPIVADTISEGNRIQISAQNNLLNLPFANSYAIGADNNRILAINSAAIEMSDAKFGEFPLYVFTEEGIFTLQSGSGEVLYSSVVPLNYDRIVNPATLAVNHNILYMTARGIQAMFSNESKLISGPINDRHDMPPLDYLRGALMCYQHPTNEVIVWNREAAAGRAYVFSLDNGCWSTRDFEGCKLNTDELVVRRAADAVDLLDLNSEKRRSDAPVSVHMVSRPIKFGSAEFKRLETFIPRLQATTPQTMRLLFEGSADLETWITLRDTGQFSTDRDVTLRRFPTSMRYLRITLDATINASIELTQFDAEYYLRFVHRLR